MKLLSKAIHQVQQRCFRRISSAEGDLRRAVSVENAATQQRFTEHDAMRFSRLKTFTWFGSLFRDRVD